MRVLVVVALFAACGPKTPVAPAPEPAPTETAAPAMLPPAFDAATLRAGFPVGTVVRYRIVEGGLPRVEEWAVTASDETGCTLHTKVFAADGVTLTEESDSTSAWAELESHGTFPAATTTRTDSTWDAGIDRSPYPTWYYEVLPAEPGGMTSRFQFSPAHVGPPVWAQFSQGDQVVISMELLSRTGP